MATVHLYSHSLQGLAFCAFILPKLSWITNLFQLDIKLKPWLLWTIAD